MDSYSLHFDRMSNVDLHPLSLSVSRLSPAKSNSSIVDHLAHHQHGKGDSAYSSFSGGSTAPDYPSPFLPDDLQSSSFSHYADLKYVKSIYHPTQFLQSDSKTMDQLCCPVEAISQQYCNNTNVSYPSHNGNNTLHTNNNAHPKIEVHSKTPSQSGHAQAHAPPVPIRLDSFIATKNLENSRVHLQGTEFKPLPQQPQQQLRPQGGPNASRSETASLDKGSSNLSSEPLYSVWRGPYEMQQAQHLPSYRLHLQLHNQTRATPESSSVLDDKAASEPHRSANSLSPPQVRNQPQHLTPKQPSSSSGCNGDHQNQSSSHFRSERKRAHSAQEWHSATEPQRATSSWNNSQSFHNSSIQHKGQFYFVTGVYKPSESSMRAHSSTISGTEAAKEVSTLLETPRQRDKERAHSTMDNFFRPLQESSHRSSGIVTEDEEVFLSVGKGMDLMSKSIEQQNYRPPHTSNVLDEIQETGRHTASNPIFYCGPDRKSPPHSAPHQNEVGRTTTKLPNYNKREDHVNRGNRQPLEEVGSERINKDTTPLLYHLTGASRTVLQPKTDPGFSGGKEAVLNKSVQGDLAINSNERPAQADTGHNQRCDIVSVACGTIDDSFKKYYKEKLKDAQCKVLRETSFKRKDLQLPWPHCLTQNSEYMPPVIHSFSSSQDSEVSTDTLTPSFASDDTEKGSISEFWENQKEIEKSVVRENGRVGNVAQPQVARIGSRKRLTSAQKKMCFSEPEKLNELGGTPSHSVCRSFGNESEGLFAGECDGLEEMQQAEQGLVAARRMIFESRGRALSVSSTSKTNLKHLRHQALMEYMERKTGQKVAEPQQPASNLPIPSRQRHSLGEKPFDWSSRPQSWNHEKQTKKKHHRPHSAGRILDSPSSSIRYAQFFSAQSCSGHFPGHQNLSRPRESQGPSQGKSASAESLLDQREPISFLRSRSTSTPQTFQTQDNEEDLLPVSLPVNTMETPSCQKNESEEQSDKQAPQGQQRSRKVGQRGKSMEELGALKITKVSTLSKSSEHLDQLGRNSAEPAGGSTSDRRASQFTEDKQARRLETRKEAEIVGQNNSQGQSPHQTQKNYPEKQSFEQGGDATEERSPGRSISPFSGGEPNELFSNPPSPGGQKISEWEIESTAPTPTQTKSPCGSTPISSRSGTPPGLEREPTVDKSSSETNHEVSLSCGVTTDPSLWILPPEEELKEVLLNAQQTNNVSDEPGRSISAKQTSEPSVSSSMSVSEAAVSQQADTQNDPDLVAETVGKKEERGTPEGETNSSDRSAKRPKWEELVKAVVKVDQSLAKVLCPLANRKTALMLMEQLLSEDTLLMEEHYKKKQEQKGEVESSEVSEGAEPSPCPPDSDGQKSQCADEQSRVDITEKKHLLVSYINEHLRSLEELRSALQTEVEENLALGEAMKLLVRERCLPVEVERYNLFIGDLERVVNLLLCLSARLARVQNALSVVDQHTDAEEKESLDSRHRLLCKQREDAKDLKDNLDRRENLVSTFLSRQLSAEQLQDYRRFVQTKASLLIRQKDLEEKQRLGEEQLEALSNSLNM